MQFIYPSFLFALAALAIPVIIHLFNFRKFKKIYFTNVKFLREIKQETQSKSQLKHLLILLARILAIAFLVFAFAQPYIPVSKILKVSGDKVVSIFIDNSFSMDAQGKAGSLLDQAKKNAQEVLAAYKPSDRFQLLTNDFEGKHQRLLNKEEFTEMLQEVKSTASVKSVSEILSRQFDLLNTSDSKSKSAYIISDFQKTNYNLLNAKNDSSVQVTLIPLEGNSKNNVYIDSCWFTTPLQQINKAVLLNVRISNASDAEVENAPIKLFINKQQKALASFTVNAHSDVTVQLSFTCKETGIQNAQLQITDYPITFDDNYYLSFDVARQISILSINEENESNSINSLFARDSSFKLTNASQKNIDYASFSKNNFIILNELKSISSGLAQELKRFVNAGGSLLIFPNNETELVSYQSFLTSVNANFYISLDTANTRVDKINLAHTIYDDVFDKKKNGAENIDLPVVLSHYVINNTSHSNIEYLMRLQNGEVFLGKNNFGKGKIYLSSVPLNNTFSNFTKHAMFVPTLYKMALYSVSPSKLFYTIGKDDLVEINNSSLTGDDVYHLKSVTGNFDIVPEHKVYESGTKINLHEQLKIADNYLLTANKDTMIGLAFNYDRKESNLDCYDNTALEAMINKSGSTNFTLLSGSAKDLTTSLRELNQGKRYWKWCIVLVLIFLASEAALIRFLK